MLRPRCYAPAVADRLDIIVREFRPTDVAAAVSVLAGAFHRFPVLEVIVGTDDAAPARLQRLFEMEFEAGSRNSALVAEVEGQVVGVLTYADSPACTAISAGRTVRFMRLAGTRLLTTLRVFSHVDRVHPRTKHRHLPSVGVDPTWQGRGIGEKLMQRFEQGCDEANLEGYLETIRWAVPGRPSHESFYQRHGFAVADELPMADDWRLLTMKRPLRAARLSASSP